VALAKVLVGMEFPTEDALDKYLDLHPDADRSKHTVKKEEKEPAKKDEGEAEHKPVGKPHKKTPIRRNTLEKVKNVMKANGLEGEEDEMGELAGFKKTLGQRVPEKDIGKYFVRNAQKLKKDFIANMDASNYKSPEAFKAAKDRMSKMAVGDFAKILAAINEDEEAAKAASEQGGVSMSRERMTGAARNADGVEQAISALEKAFTAVDDAEITQEADALAKAEKDVVSESVPAGTPELKDEGDQNAKANANWPLTDAEREKVAGRLVKLAKQLLKA
jgi:hypothetical protein